MSEEHQRYIILEGKSPAELEEMVNNRIDTGWKLIGGLAYNSNGYYLQAMFKRNELAHETMDY